MEKNLEAEKAAALQEMSRGKTGALQALQTELGEKNKAEVEAARAEVTAEWEAKLQV